MELKCKTPRELNNLTFSVWNKLVNEGHALLVGNAVEIAHYLENNNTQHLEVSILDTISMESCQSTPAAEWLDWYYQTARSAVEEDMVINVFKGSALYRSSKTFALPGFSAVATVEMN